MLQSHKVLLEINVLVDVIVEGHHECQRVRALVTPSPVECYV